MSEVKEEGKKVYLAEQLSSSKYRAVSLTSVPGKIEKIILGIMEKYLKRIKSLVIANMHSGGESLV